MIPASPHLELLRRLGNMPLEPLVEKLRRLHEQGTADHGTLQSLVAHTGTDAGHGPHPPDPETRAVAPDYEAARRHFVAHAQRLREQALLAERLLGRLVSSEGASAPAPLQRELTLRCARSGRSHAEVVVANPEDRPLDVQFRVGHVHGLERQAIERAVSFDPPALGVRGGTEQAVRLTVNLEECADVPDVFEFGVDVLGDDRVLRKLWVRVAVDGGGPAQDVTPAPAGAARLELNDAAAAEMDLLRRIQRALLTHPVACQAAFTALLAEGRRFAETTEGRAWRDRLIGSSLLGRARLVFDLSTLGMLEERGGGAMPSSYLDALFMVATAGETDEVMNRLFWGTTEAGHDGRSRA